MVKLLIKKGADPSIEGNNGTVSQVSPSELKSYLEKYEKKFPKKINSFKEVVNLINNSSHFSSKENFNLSDPSQMNTDDIFKQLQSNFLKIQKNFFFSYAI